MSRTTLQKNIAWLMALLLSLTLLFAYAPAAQASESGSCGPNLSWTLNAGTLTISGSGAMTDFPESTMAPWYPYRADILRLELPDGLTNIGDLAFYGCKNLTVAVIPGSVTAIGDFAFANCESMQLLTIGSSVRTIGEAAFSDCYSIQSLDLPGSLISIGTKGFYRCESITTVTVPSSVTSMGVSVFAYCEDLVSANVHASIKTLPEYTFYGCERLASVTLPDMTEDISSFSFRRCDQLNTVYYGGSNKTLPEIQEIIGTGSTVTDELPGGPITSGSLQQNPDGTLTQDNITVNPGDNSSVSTKVENTYQPDGTPTGSSKTEINVTVNGDQGWDEVKETIEKELESTDQTGNVDVNIFVKDTDEIDPGFVESLTGKPINVTITTQNGSTWKVDAAQIDEKKPSGKYNLSYTLSEGTEEMCTELETETCFILRFANSAQINSEVLIHLGGSWTYQEATLFQRDKKELIRIQAVVVDGNGYAHFYLASVDSKTEYLIGMNLPREEDMQVIIPEGLYQNTTLIDQETGQEYAVTGRTSSWGMGLGQVMGILAAVMIGVIVLVGVIMYAWNKKRLKAGYVPQWDDEEAYK